MLNPPNPNRTDERLGEIYQKSLNVMRNIRAHALDGPTGKKSGPTFSMSQVATLVGRKPSAIREAEYAGRLPPQPRGANGRRQKYTLDDISQLRTLFEMGCNFGQGYLLGHPMPREVTLHKTA